MPLNRSVEPSAGGLSVPSAGRRDLIGVCARDSSQCCPPAPLTHQPSTTAVTETRMATVSMPQETAGVIVGVDTHADVHVAAALDPLGRALGRLEICTTPTGYGRL